MPRKKQSEDDLELRFLEALSRRSPDHVRILQALGDMYTQTGQIREGLAVDLRLSSLAPGDGTVWYNLACSYALSGSKDDAFAALEKAVFTGYAGYDWMQEDKDLESIRNDPRFKQLMTRMKGSGRQKH